MTISNFQSSRVENQITAGWIIIFKMKTKIVIAVIVLILFVTAGMVLFAWSVKPQLVEISPQAGAINVPAATAIRLVFSGEMNPETVRERLKIEPEIEGEYNWDKTC
jgi:hypothetical protein